MKRPDRKPTRLKAYDYSSPGSYFITICTKDRKSILSKIIVGDGVLDVPENKLTHYGKTSDRIICEMNDFYNHISVDKYVIMPNHIHLLLTISATDDDITSGMSGTPSPTNSHIAKFISTFKRFSNREFKENIWQRMSYDHIIRNQDDYRKIWEYIDSNIVYWTKDELYQ